MSAEGLLLMAWTLWCALHSLLIANSSMAFQRRLLGRGFRFQRAAYVAFSLVTLIPLIQVTKGLDPEPVLVWTGLGRLVPAVGLALAALLFIAGGRHYSAGQFLGLAQWRSGTNSRLLSGGSALDTSGVLGLLRHPWYTATFLLLWSRNLTALEIQVNGLLSIYLVVGTLLEERKLVQEFGDRYLDYQRRVSMFVPWKWLRARMAMIRNAR